MVCGASQQQQRHTTKLFIPRSHYTRATTNYPGPSSQGNKANLVDRFQNVIQGTADGPSGRFSRFSG